MERPNAWKAYTDEQFQQVQSFGEDYKTFLDNGKTERECVAQTVRLVREAGYISLDEAIRAGKPLKPGDKLYAVQMKKSIVLFHIGKEPLERGINLLGAHIDSPRIDLKQNPLYEDNDLAYADTHYYGGIKKYQWVARPLALHGVVAKKDGTVLDIVIGENDQDPVVGISDLLPHLAQEQVVKKASEFINGEGLDVILAGQPLKGAEKDAVKANLLKILKERYGLEEEDFLSAEIEIVPAGKTRDLGLDRSMILGYGHDDRVCAYACLRAMLCLTEPPKYTCAAILTDKEEIGSVGATGMEAKYFENAVSEMLALNGQTADIALRRTLANSRMLSCDVSAGFDPLYSEAFEKKNAAFLGRGVCYNKFTGARGKSGSNDANAEFLGRLRKVMDDNDIRWQTAELGRVDLGGGGTIAYICALYGMEVIDSGVAVLSMHAPFEIISKADLYEAMKAYLAFLTDMGAREDAM